MLLLVWALNYRDNSFVPTSSFIVHDFNPKKRNKSKEKEKEKTIVAKDTLLQMSHAVTLPLIWRYVNTSIFLEPLRKRGKEETK